MFSVSGRSCVQNYYLQKLHFDYFCFALENTLIFSWKCNFWRTILPTNCKENKKGRVKVRRIALLPRLGARERLHFPKKYSALRLIRGKVSS